MNETPEIALQVDATRCGVQHETGARCINQVGHDGPHWSVTTIQWQEGRAHGDEPALGSAIGSAYLDIVQRITHEVYGKSAYIDIAISVRRGLQEAIDRFAAICKMDECARCGSMVSIDTETTCAICRACRAKAIERAIANICEHF